jgi:type IV secretion system protein VirB8
MLGRRKATPKIDGALAQSVNYEISLADLAHRSERRAWFVAGSATLLALLLAGGYFIMLPLKERTPFLVIADAYTGTATVARLTSGLSGSNLTANQAVNRANIARYVSTRESYDYDLLNARDWRVVFTMSTPEVASSYRALYSSNNPDSPIKLYGKANSIRINIISITPTQEGWFGKKGGANVRFQRVKVSKANGGTEILDTKSATLLYTYSEELPLTEEQRFDNPLGFQVTDYRVVDELISIPVQPPSAAPAAAQCRPQRRRWHQRGRRSLQASPSHRCRPKPSFPRPRPQPMRMESTIDETRVPHAVRTVCVAAAGSFRIRLRAGDAGVRISAGPDL